MHHLSPVAKAQVTPVTLTIMRKSLLGSHRRKSAQRNSQTFDQQDFACGRRVNDLRVASQPTCAIVMYCERVALIIRCFTVLGGLSHHRPGPPQ